LRLSVQIFITRLPTEKRKALGWLWDHRKVNIFPKTIDFKWLRPDNPDEPPYTD